MAVLIDSSVWISYFRSAKHAKIIDYLIDENIILSNEIILAELVPFLQIKNQLNLIKLLNQIKKIPLEIDWSNIIDMQVKCLKNGISGIGIADMIIAQNAIKHQVAIFSEDKHFLFLQNVTELQLYQT